ncbi:MAG: nicotinate (nicotinamide) nucleotide adenylyltransferase [Chloroflexi bacterium]|nr:nicotinate (nicotinamide) nucleotide adenylyltransferase [Chloroflexota bacterium]
MRLGLFGGTFDPPHLGHLILAEEARTQLNLDRVLWLVSGQSTLKLDRELSPVEARIEMVQAAIADNPHFILSRVDIDRPPPHYTIDALKILAKEFPRDEFYFIMGEDSLRDLPRWREPQEIIKRVTLAVLARPNPSGLRDPKGLDDLESKMPGVSSCVVWVNAPQLEIASSEIQKRIREGKSVRYMVTEGVGRVVEERKLYVGG